MAVLLVGIHMCGMVAGMHVHSGGLSPRARFYEVLVLFLLVDFRFCWTGAICADSQL